LREVTASMEYEIQKKANQHIIPTFLMLEDKANNEIFTEGEGSLSEY
jgi:hypothetical protein